MVTTEANKALLLRFDAEVWNAGDVSVMDELFAPDYVNHDPSLGQPPDREGHKRVIAMVREALPDLRETVDDLVAEDDRVVFRWTVTATHERDFMGTPATGKRIEFSGIEIYRIADGRIAERWGVFDRLGMLRQLGVIRKPER